MDENIPVEKSDPLSEDSFKEKFVWRGLIWLTYSVFIAMFLVAGYS